MGRVSRRGGALLAVLVLAWPASVSAQTTPAAPPGPAPQAPPPAPLISPPYEGDLLRLAAVLGALHHLRGLCGAKDGSIWRDRMAALMESEAANGPEWRDRLAGAFNASYRTYVRSYTSCTPAAQLVIRRFLGEGARISRSLAQQYGN